MRISPIQYQSTCRLRQIRQNQTKQNPISQNQPAFKSGGKGLLIGGICGLVAGIAVTVLTGGIGAIGLGAVGMGACGYGVAGAVVGNALEDEDDNNKFNANSNETNVNIRV